MTVLFRTPDSGSCTRCVLCTYCGLLPQACLRDAVGVLLHLLCVLGLFPGLHRLPA